MRRIMIVALSAALLTTTALVVHGAAAGSTGTAGATTLAAAANTGPPADERALEHGVRATKPASLASQLAAARLATGRYATNLGAARADGYQIITRMIPDFEWVFPTKPATPPLPGATYGSFGAACHYTDGTFVFARVQELCAKRSPETGARFNFWHPDLVTLHVWLWYPNPAGLYSGTNPFIRPFNHS